MQRVYWLGECGPLTKTFALFITTICDFPALFMTWSEIWYLIYYRCSWHSCPIHKICRAFVDGLIDNDEKVASSKNMPSSRKEFKNHTLCTAKTAEKPYNAHTYIAHIFEYLPTKKSVSAKYHFDRKAKRVREVKKRFVWTWSLFQASAQIVASVKIKIAAEEYFPVQFPLSPPKRWSIFTPVTILEPRVFLSRLAIWSLASRWLSPRPSREHSGLEVGYDCF